jgi:hypothetical protein
MQWVQRMMGGGHAGGQPSEGALAAGVAVGGGTGGGAAGRLAALRNKAAKASTRPSLLDKSK